MIKDLTKKLNMTLDSPFIEYALDKALAEKEHPYFLTKEFLDKLNFDYKVIPENYNNLLLALNQINQTEELILLSKILYNIVLLKKPFSASFTKLTIPIAPKELKTTIGYDLLLVFPILAGVPLTFESFRSRGIDKKYISDTIANIDYNISRCSSFVNKPCFSEEYFLWYNELLETNSLRLGRLRFEILEKSNFPIYVFKNSKNQIAIMLDNVKVDKDGYVVGQAGHTDDKNAILVKFNENQSSYFGYLVDKNTNLLKLNVEFLNKNEWKLILKPNDSILLTHIPYSGKFNIEAVEESFKLAKQVYSNHYKEYNFKAFITQTWMTAPELKLILSENSNIIKFRNCFHCFPLKDTGLDVFLYVFNLSLNSFEELIVDKLKEDTSLMRGVKSLIQQNIFIHEYGGFKEF